MKRAVLITIIVIALLLTGLFPAIAAAPLKAAAGVADSPTPTAPGATLTLSPGSGFSAITLSGKGFPANFVGELPVVITWDGAEITKYPSPLFTSHDNTTDVGSGMFTAIINVPSKASAGSHKVKASQNNGDGTLVSAEANFSVIDMPGAKGPVGDAGAAGVIGDMGAAGFQGAAGNRGAAGAMGPAGPSGSQGAAGDQGGSGARGQSGPPGPAGNPGLTGAAGPAGAGGPEGKPGATGAAATSTTIGIIALVVAAGTLALFVVAKMKKWIFG